MKEKKEREGLSLFFITFFAGILLCFFGILIGRIIEIILLSDPLPLKSLLVTAIPAILFVLFVFFIILTVEYNLGYEIIPVLGSTLGVSVAFGGFLGLMYMKDFGFPVIWISSSASFFLVALLILVMWITARRNEKRSERAYGNRTRA